MKGHNFAMVLKKKKVKAGDTVIKEGDTDEDFYMVDEGKLYA